MNPLLRTYLYECQEFKNKIINFCQMNGIPISLLNALKFKSNNSYLGKFFSQLYIAPMIYLSNSRGFNIWRMQLDNDIMNEILTNNNIAYFKKITNEDIEFKEKLKKLMGDDFNG